MKENLVIYFPLGKQILSCRSISIFHFSQIMSMTNRNSFHTTVRNLCAEISQKVIFFVIVVQSMTLNLLIDSLPAHARGISGCMIIERNCVFCGRIQLRNGNFIVNDSRFSKLGIWN